MQDRTGRDDRHGGLAVDRRTLLRAAGGAGVSLALGAAPGGTEAAETPRRGGHLVVGLTGGATTDSLDPTLADSYAMGSTLKQFTDRLIMPTPDGRDLEPTLAETWDHSADFQSWTFKLRKGVEFHNGKSMTAKDVVFSLNRNRGPDSKSGAAGSLKSITDIKATGDLEFTVALDAPNVEFPYLLTDYHLVIQPDGDKGDSGIGTGPYALTEVKHGVRYLSKKFDQYWRADAGFVETIETLVINDNSARVAALLNGQVHLINRVEPKVVAFVKRSGDVRVVPTGGRGHYVFAMRCDAAPFDNADLRMALKLAIDREAMVKQILRGFGDVGNDSPINTPYPLATSFPVRRYDPAQAAMFYKKSGHSGPITLHTSDVAFAGAVDAAALFKDQAAKAGIVIEVQRDPGDGYWDNVWNKAPFCATYWDGRPTQDQMLSIAYRSDAPWNETAWKRPAFDALLDSGRRETDKDKRSETYRQAQAMIRDDGGAIVPMFAAYLDGVSNKVKGYVVDINNELSNDRYAERCWLA